MRRSLLGAALLVLLANVAVLTTGAAHEPPARVAALTLPGEPERSTTTSTTVATTSTLAPTTTAPARPVDPPQHAYAEEPHVVIGQIEIPKLGLNVPLNEGISLRSIDRGPSHWPGTALPGQASGNVVVAGHRVTHTHPFREIDTLVPGDEIIFIVDGIRSVYSVTGHEVVTPSRTDIVNQTPEPIATLFACHPPHSARYRYVVRASLVSTAPV
jgi:sortase A